MPDIARLIAEYGYQSLFLALFLEAVGFPIPGAIGLLAAGAAAASGAMNPILAFVVPAIAQLIGDTLLYLAGRYTGWTMLSFLCRLSLNPETCILRAAHSFYERGRTTLLIAKFLPGVNTMAPPLAGSMNMRPGQFLRLDFGGVLIYTLAYEAVGFAFNGAFQAITRRLETLGRAAQWLIGLAILGYIGYRAWIYWRHREYRAAPRVSVAQLAEKLESELGGTVLIADVRSHGYYDSGAQRIRGSIRLEPNNIDAMLETLPKDRPIYVYCS